MTRERLTFGFKNTELLFGTLIFSFLLSFLTYLVYNVDFNIYFILLTEVIWGIVFRLTFDLDNTLKERGYFGSFVWAVALISPITFIVYKNDFRYRNCKNCSNWCNKI